MSSLRERLLRQKRAERETPGAAGEARKLATHEPTPDAGEFDAQEGMSDVREFAAQGRVPDVREPAVQERMSNVQEFAAQGRVSDVREPAKQERMPDVREFETQERGADARADAQELIAPNEWAALGAQMLETEEGCFVMRRRYYPAGYIHGRCELAALDGRGERLLPMLGAAGGDFTHEKLLFLDTETTGLGIGAGNVPFMIGLGYYEGADFITEQMLIRHPGEEFAMLCYLQDRLAQRPLLVSYNGKSFDWPIIRSRYVMNRVRLAREPQGHIDFLYPARSLWRYTLPSCRLGSVEAERLGVRREDDVPGSQAPALYFEYLSTRQTSLLEGVFIHNEIDLLSLAGLAVHFADMAEGRFDWSTILAAGSQEAFRLGLWLTKLGQEELADGMMRRLYADLVAKAESPAPELDCALPLAQYFKQRGQFAEACALWRLCAAPSGGKLAASPEPCIELSMFYEHREKSARAALEYAEQALESLRLRGALHRPGRGAAERAGRAALRDSPEWLALEKRIARLRRKAEKEGRQAAAAPRVGAARRRSVSAEAAPRQLSLPLESAAGEDAPG